MNPLRLIVEPDAYELRLDTGRMTRLDGGAAALLARARSPLGEIDMEIAIERAEDWLMPFTQALDRGRLEVCDRTGRLRAYFGAQPLYSPEHVEQAFTRVHDAVVHGRVTDRLGVADVVLLRELAHHAKLTDIEVHFGEEPTS